MIRSSYRCRIPPADVVDGVGWQLRLFVQAAEEDRNTDHALAGLIQLGEGDAGALALATGRIRDRQGLYRRIDIRADDDLEVLDPPALEPFFESGRWVTLGTYGDETEARIEPFEAVPLDLASWWPPAAPEG